MCELGMKLIMSPPPLQDTKLGLQWLQPLVDAGEPDALARLGELYMEGVFLPRDEKLALKVLLRAAQARDSRAILTLSKLALRSPALFPATTRPIDLVRDSAQLGSLEAQLLLADIYL